MSLNLASFALEKMDPEFLAQLERDLGPPNGGMMCFKAYCFTCKSAFDGAGKCHGCGFQERWTCMCGEVNLIEVEICERCENPRPEGS